MKRVFSMHSIGFLLCATKPGWKSALKTPEYYVSPETQINARCKQAAKTLGTISGSSSNFRLIFPNDGRWNKEIDTRIGEANAVLRELHRSAVTKRELSNTAELSVFKPVFVPILPLSRNFATECVAEVVKLWISSLFTEPRGPKYVGSAMWPVCPISVRQVMLAHTHGKTVQRSATNQVEWLRFLPCLFPSWRGASRTIWEYCLSIFQVFLGVLTPSTLPTGKGGLNKWQKI